MDDKEEAVTLLGPQGSITASTLYDLSGAVGAGAYYGPYSISNGGSMPNISITDANTSWSTSAVLDLKGDNADIKINGESLCDTLRSIQDRLNILRPNTELESQWDQLRELGEAYRRLEAELLEKQRMWDTLKHMPPPEIK
jgi:hypothetical protein